MTHKVIIDADPGIGDALAIALALTDPRLDVLALTATAGVVSGEQATRNLQSILESLDPVKWPRLGCCSNPTPVSSYDSLGGNARPVDLHGTRGLGEIEPPVSSLQHLKSSVKLMTELVREMQGDITLLTFGPLTNIQLAVERMPDFLEQLNRLVCFGGVNQGPGDVTAVADFNFHADPDAAHAVMNSHCTKTLVPLDVASQFVFSFEELNRFQFESAGALGGFFKKLVTYFLRANHSHLGVEGVSLSELLALMAVTEPAQLTTEMRHVDVELQGDLTRGMSVIDRRMRTQTTEDVEIVVGFNPSDLEHELSRFFEPIS
ncbi:MAG: nucleoside hydrolase [Planctomycetaceae bacterium]|nr:nucleoside hydrolase [Planctomycetaceae bacterium]